MKKIFLFLTISLMCMSCSKWDDYIKDYDFTAVYFSYQNQLRTIVADDDMSFEFGVYMGGRRENTRDEWATYKIVPELLEDKSIVGNNKFKLLPEDWYTLSDKEKFIIHNGSFLGTAVLTLDKKKFTSDPDALKATYALPVRIVDTSADKILSGEFYPEEDGGGVIIEPKDYAVIVVKYINGYHGNWYVKGKRSKKDETGEYVEDEVYLNKDLSRNKVLALTTVDLNTTRIPAAGYIQTEKKLNYDLDVVVADDGKVSIDKSSDAVSILTFETVSSAYNPETRTFHFEYRFSDKDGEYLVDEELIWRNTDLHFEQW